MNKHMLIEAFNYKKWSDQHTLDAARNIDRETFPAAAAFVRQQINHMVIVEELFRARLLAASAPHDSTNTDVVPGSPRLRRESVCRTNGFLATSQNSTRLSSASQFLFDSPTGSLGP